MGPQLYSAKVMHKRFFPKENAFSYRLYYLFLPLPAAPLSGYLTSFHAKDVGNRDGSDPTPWVRNILAKYNLNQKTQTIILVTMPRVLGYVFNPVSFYLCLDEANLLRAVLYEAHNTFGEQHSYLCANSDHRPIGPDQWLEAEKVFHVSPFLERCGHYKFRFDLKVDKLGVWIDYYDAQQKKQLITSLMGTLEPLTPKALRQAFRRHPLVALKAIILIHWQALRLMMKGIGYITKPKAFLQKVTTNRDIKKM